MKKFLIIVLSFLISVNLYADSLDYLYLNNGNVVKGIIQNQKPEDSATITIKSDNGEIYVYNKSEIRKITKVSPTLPTARNNSNEQFNDYAKYNTGLWYSIETNVGYSINVEDENIGFVDLDIVGGYRFNEYLRLGLGFGARYYINNDEYRSDNVEWAFPLFFNVRGNIIPSKYRNIVPFYSFDIGGVCRDGFMMRPTIGVRFGEPRSAFVLGLSYMGQSVKGYYISELGEQINKNKFTSFIALKLGYEF